MASVAKTGRAARRSATIEDVARLAGVSRATASRVVNHNPQVRPEARAAVEAAVEALHYVPNRAARSLMTRRTDSIGVVIPESTAHFFADPFFGYLLRGISDVLSESDVQLVLFIAPTVREEARVAEFLEAGHVDGAILVGPRAEDPMPMLLARQGVPIVLSGRSDESSPLSYVDADNRGGARLAVEHLLSVGCTRIATIHGALGLWSARDRLAGYHDALAAAGLPQDPTLEADGDFRQDAAADAVLRLLEQHPDLDGVFAASDAMGVAAARVLREAGRRVPEDVAVVGFDDAPLATSMRPTLSTIRQPITRMGQELARLLLRRVANPAEPPGRVVFPTELVVRESSSRGS